MKKDISCFLSPGENTHKHVMYETQYITSYQDTNYKIIESILKKNAHLKKSQISPKSTAAILEN